MQKIKGIFKTSQAALILIAIIATIIFLANTDGRSKIADIKFADPNLKACIDSLIEAKQIEYIHELTELNCSIKKSERSLIKSLYGIEDLKYLKSINLANENINQLTPLIYLKHLKALNLENNKIESLNTIRQINSLKELNLNGNKIKGVINLGKLNKLKKLELERNQITNLTFLAKLKKVETLNLKWNRIRNIEPLSSLKRLKDLKLNDNLVRDIAVIYSLNKLENLDLANNKLRKIDPLSSLRSIVKLNLSNNEINDISPLSKLKVQNLVLTNNRINNGVDLLLSLIDEKQINKLWGHESKIKVSLEGNNRVPCPELKILRSKVEELKGTLIEPKSCSEH